MAFGDLVNVHITESGRKLILDTVFSYTGSNTESTTAVYLFIKVNNYTNGTPEADIVQEVRFREFTGSGGATGTRIQEYAVAIPANRKVVGFEIKDQNIPTGRVLAEIILDVGEQKDFATAGVLYIDRIAFDMNATVL